MQRRRRRATQGQALAIVLVMLTAACVAQPDHPYDPDPGNRLLNRLAADPIFTELPSMVSRLSLTKTPRHWSDTAFEEAGWDGPSVVEAVSSSASILSTYRAYAQLAAQAGWKPDPSKVGRYGVIWLWSKLLVPGAHAILTVLPSGSGENTSPQAWTVQGSTGYHVKRP